MATTKKTNAQPAATPFSTTGGSSPGLPNYAGQRPTDLVAQSTSDAQRAIAANGRNFPADSRAQTSAEAPSPAAPEKPDDYGAEGASLDESSIPAGGVFPRATPTSSRGNGADG